MFHDLFGKQPIIVSLDIDAYVEKKIELLVNAGITNIELLSCSANLITRLRHRLPNIRIGLGNILTVDQLELGYQMKFDFMSSPGFMPSLVKTANVYQMPYLPGVANISEAMQAMELGCHDVRLSPNDLKACQTICQYCPTLKIYPMDVDWSLIEQYLDLPSVAAVGLTNPDDIQMIQICESIQL